MRSAAGFGGLENIYKNLIFYENLKLLLASDIF